jgi:hypothetical protein
VPKFCEIKKGFKMSLDYSMTSINSINENIYNAQKLAESPKHRLRKIFKPILKMLLSKGKKANNKQHICKCQNISYESNDYTTEISDNDANETLETRIHDEIRECSDNSAIYVYGDEDRMMSVTRDQTFVPVHFARTNAGTFFWTTFDESKSNCTTENFQLPQLYTHKFDRWIQA